MSVYAMAASQGIQALATLTTGDTAAYNVAYAAAAKRAGIADAKHTAELNITAIRQDTITSNTEIRMKQDQAEALARVSAAAAGMEGGSLDAVLYDTERSEAFAINANKARETQATEQQLSAIGSQQSALLAVTEPESSLTDAFAGELTQTLGAFEMTDLAIGEALLFDDGSGNVENTFENDFNASNIDPFGVTA